MDFSTFATDAIAEQDGKWFEFGTDARIKLRSFSSKISRDVRKTLEKPYIGLTRSGTSLPDDILEDLLVKQMAKALIVDWSGFTDEGKEIPYSSDVAETLLSKYPKLRDRIAKIIADDESFAAEAKVQSEGN